MSRSSIRSLLSAALVLVLTSVPAAAAPDEWLSNWPGPEPAPDSPFWWSAFPELTAVELRAALLNRMASERRYLAAESAGLTTVSFPEEDPAEEEFRRLAYAHPDHDPELIPLWLRFRGAAEEARIGLPRWDPERGLRELEQSLAAAGMSEVGVAIVTEVVTRRQQEVTELERQAIEGTRRFQRVLELASLVLGRREAERALYLGDDEKLARFSLTPVERVRRDRPIYLSRRAELDAELARIVGLREALTDEDWAAFRRAMQGRGGWITLHAIEYGIPQPQPWFPLTHRLLPLLVLLTLAAIWIRRQRGVG